MFERILSFIAQAAPPSPAPTQPPSPAPTQPTSPGAHPCGELGGLIPLFVIMFGIMYVLMILPQRRREKKRRLMLSALKKNDHILTIGGVYGIITSVKDDRITIRIDDNKDVKLTVTPSSIASVISREKEEEESEEAEDKEEK